jgi:tryptophan-rich hypothetical protein
MEKNKLNLINHINPKKLLHSKWTSVCITNKEKHFIVTKVNLKAGSLDQIESIEIEAIISKSVKIISWLELKDVSIWLQGWK